METAYHPALRRPYTIEQYVREYGPKLDYRGHERKRPQLVCYGCMQPMYPVGETLPGSDGHWSHFPQPNAPWCPTKELAARPYELLHPGCEDPEHGRRLRQLVFEHWRHHWSVIQTMVPLADIHTFIGFLRQADAKKFWQHRNLEEWFMPYICLATCDFEPPKNQKAATLRPEWIRFWFDARIRTIEDLWIRTTGDFRMMRALYQAPARGGKLTPKHLIRVEPIAIDQGFLDAPLRRNPNPYQEKAMLEFAQNGK